MMKLILFDIDGTLVRVRRDVLYGVLSDVVRRGTGHDGVHDIELHGKTDRQIMLEICSAAGIEGDEAARRCELMVDDLLACWREHLNADTVELLPGVVALLERLHGREGLRLGLLTGNLEPAAFMKLAPHDLNRFFSVGSYGSDAVDRNALPPIALERANAGSNGAYTFERTLIVGDSHRDIECARAWGIRSLAVATGSLTAEQLQAYAPDGVCGTLDDDSFILDFLGAA